MNLSLEQIKAMTLGAIRVERNDHGYNFYRFTEEQQALYKNRSDDFYIKTFATSGVQLSFLTNSNTLFLSTAVTKGSSRNYFSFDVFVNGNKVDSLSNFDEATLHKFYAHDAFPFGEFSKEFSLGDGEKKIEIYFPWSVNAVIKEIKLDDESFIKPIKPTKKLLCFGDSITQGYDTLYPSNKYTTRLAAMLDAEEYNKAIGGEIYFPNLSNTKENFEPDYISVSYGSNDWNRCSKEEFKHNCKNFFSNLVANYPNAKIFALTPIWRKDMNEVRKFGDFGDTYKIIESETREYKNITVIKAFDFVPHDETLFADARLHPNDKGFKFYFDNLARYVFNV